MSFARNQPTHTVDVETPQEARDALEAADTLDLELRDVEVCGTWEARDDIGLSRGFTCALEKIGRTWFHLKIEGETVSCKPSRSRVDFLDDGTLQLRFDRAGRADR